jgi:D-3-phosphoglycerate dehydrogenase
MKKILLLETLAASAFDLLNRADGIEVVTAYDFDLSKVKTDEIDAVITRGKGQITREFAAQFPNLQIVARAGVGLDNVDVAYASSRRIKVLNTPGVNAQTVAEHTLGLMLMLQRNMYRAVREVKDNNWAFRNEFQGDELYSKTLGIVGMGTIGKKVASMARAFGMNVIYTGTSPAATDPEYRTFSELVSEADILSLHVPLTPATRHLINSETLGKMKKETLIINTARGEVIDEDALAVALKNGNLAGYAADVMAEEPPKPNHALLQLPNVLITAHLASLTARTYTKMCEDTVFNVLALLRNQKPMDGCIFNQTQLI